MNFGPYQIGLANNKGDIIARVTGGTDGRDWESISQARVHIGVPLLGGAGRLFILDCEGDIIEEIAGDGPKQLAAHEAYDAYMAPERAEKAAARRAQLRARVETMRLEKLYEIS